MKEMKQFYEFIEAIDGHEEALAFIKEHNAKIADLEAFKRINGEKVEQYDTTIAKLQEVEGKNAELQKIIDGAKEGESVAMKAMQQELANIQASLKEKEEIAQRAEAEKVQMQSRNDMVSLLSGNGVNTSSQAFNDYIDARMGKGIDYKEGQLVLTVDGVEKYGSAAVEALKTARPDLVAKKEGTNSRQTEGSKGGDPYAGMSSAQKLTFGMGQ